MECPRCASTHIRKNGKQRGKQNYICVKCGRQFINNYEPKGYSQKIKRECLEIYVNGSGFRDRLIHILIQQRLLLNKNMGL